MSLTVGLPRGTSADFGRAGFHGGGVGGLHCVEDREAQADQAGQHDDDPAGEDRQQSWPSPCPVGEVRRLSHQMQPDPVMARTTPGSTR